MEEGELNEYLKQKEQELATLKEIGKIINSPLELESVLSAIVDKIAGLFDVEKCSLMLRNKLGYLVIAAAKGLDEEIIVKTQVKEGEGIAGWVAKSGKPLLVKDVKEMSLPRDQSRDYKTDSLLCFPIKIRDSIEGVINLTDKRAGSFSDADVQLLAALADQVAIAIENSRLRKKGAVKIFY